MCTYALLCVLCESLIVVSSVYISIRVKHLRLSIFCCCFCFTVVFVEYMFFLLLLLLFFACCNYCMQEEERRRRRLYWKHKEAEKKMKKLFQCQKQKNQYFIPCFTPALFSCCKIHTYTIRIIMLTLQYEYQNYMKLLLEAFSFVLFVWLSFGIIAETRSIATTTTKITPTTTTTTKRRIRITYLVPPSQRICFFFSYKRKGNVFPLYSIMIIMIIIFSTHFSFWHSLPSATTLHQHQHINHIHTHTDIALRKEEE